MEPSKLQRYSFKELADGQEVTVISSIKPFVAAAKPKEDVPPPPAYTEEDLKTSEMTGYKKGFLEGTKDGRKQAESEQADIDKKLTDLMEKLATMVSPLFAAQKSLLVQVQSEMPKIAMAIARKVAGEALSENAHTIITEMAVHCCETMVGEHKLTITAHESMGDTLERKLQQLAARLPAATDIIILRDPDMPKEDCRIEWRNGSMERSTAQLWEQIEKAVNNMSLTALRDAGVAPGDAPTHATSPSEKE